ncbi:hypothetical protein [Phenylobacterium sp.]|uniref:hypothetical protein n=1 Tax=Phenylobacterium sp. TaxID=1871053 RepID=UPI00301B84ED
METIKPTMRPTIGQLRNPFGVALPWFPHLAPMLPLNYVPCNGQTINDIRSPLNGMTLPNLNNGKFLVGGANADSGVAVGSNEVKLSAANIPAVTLTGNTGSASAGTPSGTVSVASGGAHSHTVNDPGHMHGVKGSATGLLTGITGLAVTSAGSGTGNTISANTNVTVQSGGDYTHTGGFAGTALPNHSHSLSVTLGYESPAALDNRPASVSVVWIMRIK